MPGTVHVALPYVTTPVCCPGPVSCADVKNWSSPSRVTQSVAPNNSQVLSAVTPTASHSTAAFEYSDPVVPTPHC